MYCPQSGRQSKIGEKRIRQIVGDMLANGEVDTIGDTPVIQSTDHIETLITAINHFGRIVIFQS